MTAVAAAPVYMLALPGEPWVASPSGASATRPRASIGQNDTPALMAASTVAWSCAWLLMPLRRKAAGEVDQRLLFAELAQHLRGGLQSGELAVGVEDIEFAVVLSECRAGIGAAGVVDLVSRVLPFLRRSSLMPRGRLNHGRPD